LCIFVSRNFNHRSRKHQKYFFSVKWSKNVIFHYFSWPSVDFGIFFHHEGSTFRKNWIRLFRRKILCRLRIWFFFWAFDTIFFHHGYFTEKWAKILHFFGHNFCKNENFNLLIFWTNNSTIMTIWNQKIKNAVKRSRTWWQRYR
jgi:hypothetical protein